VENQYIEQQKTIAYTVLAQAKSGDFDVVRTLTDSEGVAPTLFSDRHYGAVWRAAQDEYISAMSSDEYVYSLPGILGRIEEDYRTNGLAAQASKLMSGWNIRVSQVSMDNGDPLQAARMIKNGQLRDTFKARQPGDAERVRKSVTPAVEIAMIAHELLAAANDSGEHVSSLYDAIVEASKADPVSCGIPWMDSHLFWTGYANKGGLATTMNYVISAPSGHGKTSIAATFASSWVKQGLPAIMLSLEESRPNFTVRMLTAFTGYAPHIIIQCVKEIRGDGEISGNAKNVKDALEYLERFLFIYEVGGGINEMESIVRRHRTQFGRDIPMMVLIDHIGGMDTGGDSWSRTLELAAHAIKHRLAMQFNTAVLTFTQPSNEMEEQLAKNNYTTVFEGRASKAIKQWADYFVVMCKHNDMINTTVVQSGKNRFLVGQRVAEGGGKLPEWGVFQFDLMTGTITNRLITDDLQAEIRASLVGRGK